MAANSLWATDGHRSTRIRKPRALREPRIHFGIFTVPFCAVNHLPGGIARHQADDMGSWRYFELRPRRYRIALATVQGGVLQTKAGGVRDSLDVVQPGSRRCPYRRPRGNAAS
jgi:hypothetical protein